MKNRERILAISAAVIVVIGLGKLVLDSIIFAPLKNIEQDIVSIRGQIEKKNRQMQLRSQFVRDWEGISSQTLGDDPEQVQRVLLSRLNTLITVAGLQNVTKNPVPITPNRAGGVIRYYPVAINITGRGNLEQITKFLEMLYNEPYTVKITGLTLRPNIKSRLIAFSNCRIETIVLPKPMLPDIKIDTTPSKITATQPAPKLPDKSAYTLISEKNIFMPAEQELASNLPNKPMGIPARNDVNQVTIEQSSVGSAGKPGDLVGVLIQGGKGGVYIRNQISIKWYNLYDSLPGDLKLIFIHPLGIVVRDDLGRVMFVEIGKNIYHPVELTAESCPELYQAYKKFRADK